MTALEKKIKTIRDKIFGDFSGRVGVKDIGEHDKKMQEAQQEREEQLGSLRQQLDELELERARLIRSIDDYEGKKASLQKKDKVRSAVSKLKQGYIVSVLVQGVLESSE